MIELARPARAMPLRAVDNIESVSDTTSGTDIVAWKLVRADDPYLAGHYPGFTIYPGVFVIESVSQAVEELARSKGRSAELTAIGSVRFSAPVLPGDLLKIRCQCVHETDTILAVRAECRNDDLIKVAAMRLTFQLRGSGNV